MAFSLAFASHVGSVRTLNEDAVGLSGWGVQGNTPVPILLSLESDCPHVIAVCDGMGGHGSGDVASRFAAESLTALEPWIHELASVPSTGSTALAPLVETFQRVSDNLVLRGKRGDVSTSLGTTAVTAIVLPGQQDILVSHVGDSRAYAFEDAMLVPLTRDDRASPHDSVLTQALGGGLLSIIDLHTISVQMRRSSLLLLCSDGLVDMASDAQIESILAEYGGDLRGSCLALISAALRGGGRDNITVALLRYDGIESSQNDVLSIEL